MLDFSQPFLGGPALSAPIPTSVGTDETLYSYYDGAGDLIGEVLVKVAGDTTKYRFFDAFGSALGSATKQVRGDTVNIRIYDPEGGLIARERTITREDYTLVETWDAGGFTGAVKEIHTDTQTGVQNYDADWNLTSASLKTDDGKGRTQTAEYGPGWFVIYRETVTVSDNVTTTVIEENGAGNITGGTKVTEKADFTLTETFGAGWTLASAVKEIHTDTQTGVQYYDADWNLTSASLKTDNGNGVTQTAEYGPDWFVIYRETVTVSDNVTTTVIEENGAGNITGGTKVTEKADFTLTETFGAGWTLASAVKEIHTDSQTGVQYYDADWNLTSASLKTDDGNGVTQTAEYGPDWFVIYRETVTVSDNVTTTVIEENGAGNITGGTKVTEKADFTLTETFGAGWTLASAVKEIHTDTQTGVQFYDADWNLTSASLKTDSGNGVTQTAEYGPDWFVIYRETVTVSDNVTTTVIEENGAGNITGGTKVTEKADFTLTESFGPGWTLASAVKEIHTDTQTGVQYYDADWNLTSASLKTDDGNGVTQTAEYGPDWFVIYRETVTVSDNVTTTVIEENGAGNITGGTKVTEKAGFTLTETFGAGWTLASAVKEIHTDTQTGVQYYDADWNLTSASLKTDDGNGVTQTAEYGPDWFVIYRETVTVSDNVTTTVIEENGAGNITGGTKVTEKADFTLTETFGPGWTLTGAVKEIHTDTRTGRQVYDADWALLSASLVIVEGNRHVTEEYGADWSLISRLRVTTTEDKVVTELLEGADASLTWRKIVYGEGADVENRFEVYEGDTAFTGTVARDVIIGASGDDTFLGGFGDDLIKGGRGADSLDGGIGDDKILGEGGADLIFGRDGDDSLIGSGGNDTISGGTEDDVVDGGSGDDSLMGDSGDDTLRAGKGADTLEGGSGEDWLIAGGAGDVLSGGDDADVFVFKLSASDVGAVHTILDFELGVDEIVWDTSGAIVPGALSVATQAGGTLVSYDSDLDGTPELSVMVEGVPGLQLDDISLV